MKRETLLNNRRPIILLGILLLSVLLVWLLGPHFTFNGTIPLAGPLPRLTIIVILLVLWTFINLYQTLQQQQKQQPTTAPVTTTTPAIVEPDNKLAVLQAIFSNAVQFLQQQSAKKLFPRKAVYTRPWFLLLGNAAAGKSTLLKHAELPLIQPSKTKPVAAPSLIKDTDLCDWWCFESAIFLDLSIKHFDFTQNPTQLPLLWNELLRLLNRNRPQRPLDGIIIVIDLYELLVGNAERRYQEISAIKLQIQSINQQLGQGCPVFLLFNKCDLLAGFNEFFGELSSEERQQLWGISLQQHALSSPNNLIQQFTQQYNAMLQRLHEHIIWRLHHEHNLASRVLIKDFPVQLENIQSQLTEFIQKIFNDFYLAGQVNLRGIYFTSAIQQGTPYDNLQNSFSQALALTTPKLKTFSLADKPYFTKQLFEQLFTPHYLAKQQVISRQTNHQRIAAYAGASLLVVVGIAFFMSNFRTHNLQLNAAAGALLRYQLLTENVAHPNDMASVITILDSLHRVVAALPAPSLSEQLVNPQVQKLSAGVQRVYQQALQKQLLPGLRQLAYQQLYHTDPKNLPRLYRLLKVYLMLGDPSHLQKDFIKKWLHETWLQQTSGNSGALTDLDHDFDQILKTGLLPAKLDQTIIDSARNTLRAATPLQLALVILFAENDQPALTLFNDTQHDVFLPPYNTVPPIYTVAGFRSINAQKIQTAVTTALSGDWVSGSVMTNNITSMQLTQEVQQTYYQLYAKIWQEVISKTSLINFDNLAQAGQMLDALSGKQTQLLRLLLIIDENTAPLRDGEIAAQLLPKTTDMPDFNLQLQLLHAFIASPQQLRPLFEKLSTLSQLLQQLNAPNNANHLAFQFAQLRMLQPNSTDPLSQLNLQINKYPAPINAWLATISNNAWQLILDQAHDYVNSVWQSTVFSEFNTNLANRYPLAKNAQQQADLVAFSHFFAPNGTYDQFLQNTLQPFVNTQTSPWTLRQLDGKTIGIANNVLMQLQLAAFIKKIYFPDLNPQLAIKFLLQPIAISPSVKQFIVSTADQSLTFNRDSTPQQEIIIWPNRQPNTAVTMAFTDQQGQTVTQSASGPWAWFKLLENARLEMTGDPKRFVLTFINGDEMAKYILLAADDLNPFIPNVIDAFVCPPKV